MPAFGILRSLKKSEWLGGQYIMQTVIGLLFVNRKISSILIGTMEFVLQNIIPDKTCILFVELHKLVIAKELSYPTLIQKSLQLRL